MNKVSFYLLCATLAAAGLVVASCADGNEKDLTPCEELCDTIDTCDIDFGLDPSIDCVEWCEEQDPLVECTNRECRYGTCEEWAQCFTYCRA